MKLFTSEAINKRKKKEQLIKKVINIIITVLLLPILIYNISIIIQSVLFSDKTPDFFGIKTYVIISGSMIPELQIGDIVIVKSVAESELQQGDIISFRQGQNVITHRIIEKKEEDGKFKYTTKGDNNNTKDDQIITYKTIEGKVIKKFSKLGLIVIYLQNKIAIIVISIIIFIYFWQSEKTKKKKMQRKLKRLEYERERKID